MIERLANFIARLYLGKTIAGWHTKIGALNTTLLAISAIIIEIVQVMTLIDQGNYLAAIHQIGSPTMLGALTTLGVTKIALGIRNAIDEAQKQQSSDATAQRVLTVSENAKP